MNKKAFTLIELLVVIAIIALLLAILMPSLGKAKKIAQSVVCRNNIRQMTLGLKLYAQENEDKAMPLDHAYGKYWFHEIAPYLGDKAYKDSAGEMVSKAMETSFCPSGRKEGPGWGTDKKVWNYGGGGSTTSGSYGINCWLQPEGEQGYKDLAGWGENPDRNNFYFRLSDASSQMTPTIADAIWVGGWPDASDKVPADVTKGDGYSYMGRFAIDRHGKAINVGFVDGHVDKVPLEELWTLKWHKNFVSNNDVKINY